MKGSLKLESRSFKDWSAEKRFGSSEDVEILPLGRKEKLDSLKLPTVYQGNQPSCVSCSVVFIKQWMESSGEALSEEWLAKESGTDGTGNYPSKVLETARKTGIAQDGPPEEQFLTASAHKVGNYWNFHKFDRQTLYKALKENPLMVGVEDWNGVSGGHAMVLVDVTPEGDWIAANWWNPSEQDYEVLNKDQKIIMATGFGAVPEGSIGRDYTFDMSDVLKSKLGAVWGKLGLKGKLLAGLGALLVALGVGSQTMFGSVGLAARYSTTLSSGVSNTATTFPVSSVTLADGETFTSSNLQFPVYLTVGEGSQIEDVECWGLTSTNWTSCGRGFSWIGTAATSSSVTLAKPHAAGEKVMISNTPYQYNRYAQIYNASSLLKVVQNPLGKLVWNGTNMGWSDDGINTFTFAAGGSGITASSTKGIMITDSKILVNLASLGGLKFTSGALAVNVSSSGMVMLDSNGALYAILPGYFGNGSDGASTTGAGTYALTKDYYFTDLVVSTSTTINTGGYRIFASNSIRINGTVQNNGGDGGNGGIGANTSLQTGGTAGSAGAASGGGFFISGLAGKIGRAGGDGGAGGAANAGSAGGTGTAGAGAYNGLGSSGVAGGSGGLAGSASGAGGAAGAVGTAGSKVDVYSPSIYFDYVYFTAFGATTTKFAVSASSGSGGSGGGGGASVPSGGAGGGGSGGSGGQGGVVGLFSPTVTVFGTVKSQGGNGGNGAKGGQAYCFSSALGGGGGGGGGGSGGQGGVIIVVSSRYSNHGTVSVPGGAKGTKGAASGFTSGSDCTLGGGAEGVDGSAGNAGTVIIVKN